MPTALFRTIPKLEAGLYPISRADPFSIFKLAQLLTSVLGNVLVVARYIESRAPIITISLAPGIVPAGAPVCCNTASVDQVLTSLQSPLPAPAPFILL